MKTTRKVVLTLVCAILLVAATIMGTMAYLTSTKTVTNTFTVGKVAIKLDETDINNPNGPRTETGNAYHLLPGQTYTKDPTVTVLSGSEKSYVKMTVTFTKAAELDAIFAPNGGADLLSIFNGYDGTTWLYKGNTEDTTNDTRTYEFWYNAPVAATSADFALDALFDSITVPGTITNTQLKTIEGMTITVNAYAIQADGFADAAAAWDAYPAA